MSDSRQSQPQAQAVRAVGGGVYGPDAEFMATARKRFQQAQDAYSQNRIWQLDDLKFAAASPDNGYMWPDRIRTARVNDPNGPRPVLTINKLPQHIRLVTNEQRQNRPAIKVLPVDDKADIEVADVLNGIIRHIEYASDADTAYDIAGEMQVKIGEGYVRVLTDYCDETAMEQDITLEAIRNSFSVYMDPDGLKREPTGRFCKWCFITDEMSEEEFKAQFPDAAPIDWEQGSGEDYAPWLVDGDRVRIAEYFYVTEVDMKITLWSDGTKTIDDAMPQNAALQPIASRPSKKKVVKWAKINGFEVLQETDWAGKYIPVARMVGNEDDIEGRMEVSGLVRNTKDACRMYNYMASSEVEILGLAPKAPWVGAATQFEGFEDKWQDANVKNYPYLEYNPVDGANGQPLPPPMRMPPPLPPAGIIQAKMGAADDIQSTMGQFNPSLGAEAKEKSGIAIRARQQQADIGTFHFLDNQAKTIRQLGRIVLDLIPKIYDTRRIARIIGEDGEPDTVTLDPNQPQPRAKIETEQGIQDVYNPSLGKYDVRVTTGPSYTTKRQEAAQFMAQILQGNGELMKIIGDLYFKMIDVPGADEIAERIKKTLPPGLADDDDQDQPMVQTPRGPVPLAMASQIIAQLEQQLQAAGETMQKADVQGKMNEAEKLRLEGIGKQIDQYRAETDRITAAANIEKVDAQIHDIVFKAVAQYLQHPATGITQDPADVAPSQQPQPGVQ